MSATIKVLLLVVLAGWLMLWILRPTDTYKRVWSPKLQAATDSTYFGKQATNILLFTFPVLFVAVLGCVHLHLEQKNKERNTQRRSQRLAIWKRPLLVRGPLGIVSPVELSLLFMFLVLLVWSFSTYLRVSFSKITSASAEEDGEKLWEAKLESTALRLGLVGNICLAFLFFPVTRGSSILPLFCLTSESSVRYHVWVGHIAMAIFAAHGLCYTVFWAATGQASEMLKWETIGVSNIAGELALLCGLAMWATTIPRIRRKAFELFFYTHQLYLLFLLFFVLHVGISFFFSVLPGIFLFLVDRCLRHLQSRQGVRVVSARLLPGDTVELSFSKNPAGFHYSASSMVFVNVPVVSKLQWHPFTVTSSSGLEPERLSVVIKKEGTWSRKLAQLLSSPSPPDHLEVMVEGPYGPPTAHFLGYDSLILVSGGSGITPFISVIKELLHMSSTATDPGQSPTPSVHLICAFKNSADLSMLSLILPVSGSDDIFSRLHLRIDAFVTREKEQHSSSTAAVLDTKSNNHSIRTVWFKPRASDSPVSPALGPSSWLWLAAVISASFVAFLLLLGAINRFYIYPVDKNTNRVFSHPARSLLSLLFMCACVVGASSAAVLWIKKSVSAEGNQIRSAPTPAASPSPCVDGSGGGAELESLPAESLASITNVHYGARPNLKRILVEYCGEPKSTTSTGVLVSGPAGMRREVAAVCSSGLVENLHFESISFSW